MTMRVTEEFFGEAPNLAVLDGETVGGDSHFPASAASVPGIVTCTLPPTRLGFASPSLFLLTRTAQEGNGVKVFARTEDVANAQAYMTAATHGGPADQSLAGHRASGRCSISSICRSGGTLRSKMALCCSPMYRSTEPIS